MLRTRSCVALTMALAATGCAVAPPTGPTVLSVPGSGKDFAQFTQEDANCRQYAQAQIGYGSPAQAADDSAVGSAILGTGLGAAAGAVLGAAGGNAGVGAAIGAGTGLLMGSAIGAGNAQASGAAVQRRYDIGYAQCMSANGNKVEPARAYAPPAYGYDYGYAPGYYYPSYGYPAYPAYPYYYPSVGSSIFIGGSWGWGGHHHHW